MQAATYGELIVNSLKGSKRSYSVINKLHRIPTRHLRQMRQERLKCRGKNDVVFHDNSERFWRDGYGFQCPYMAEIAADFRRQRHFTMPTAESCIIKIRQFFRRQQLALDGFHAPEFDRKRIRIGFQPVPAIP